MAIQKERRATPRKPAAKPKQGAVPPRVSPDEIKRLIAEAAYFRAKDRGFQPGYELEDWVQAEAEVRQRLGGQ
ncbi:MAG TPA: DUF2934 domain-containing protein [Burkholderiales bacterium]|nr:DUF2934 domain-containing protein [Burkholderiales bacterium]